MIQKRFNSVVVSAAGDYFQILFERDGEDELKSEYFLLQRQFEDPEDSDLFYIESSDTELCGHVEIERAFLGRSLLRLDMPPTKWMSIQIEFAADQALYRKLARVLRTIFQNRLVVHNAAND